MGKIKSPPAWICSLKAGDKVIVGRKGDKHDVPGIVTAIMEDQNQIVVKAGSWTGGFSFHGSEVETGRPCMFAYLKQWTEEAEASYNLWRHKWQVVNRIKTTNLDDLPVEVLERAARILAGEGE